MLRSIVRPGSSFRVGRLSARALHRAAVPALTSLASRSLRATDSTYSHTPKRSYATPPPQVNVRDDFPADQYHEYSDATLETLVESLEDLLDATANPEYQVDYSSGVLTLELGKNGTYVINKQPPNKQIWLSSPTSGPKRYDYVPEAKQWVYARDQRSLGELLNTELSEVFGQDIDLKTDEVLKSL